MSETIKLNENQTKELARAISLSERIDKHLTESEADEHKNMVLMESTQYDPEDYNFVPKGNMGIPVDMLIDDGQFYTSRHTPLIMFFRNGYMDENEWIPVSISINPQILSRSKIKIFKSDLYKIRIFAERNKDVLKALADGDMRYIDFRNSVLNLRESKNQLNEMAILYPYDTGAPLRIWVDNGKTWKSSGHAPRVKIEYPKGEKDSRSYVPLKLPDFTEAIPGTLKNLPPRDVKLTLCFLNANKEVLNDITNNGCPTEEIFSRITKIDDNGNVVEQNEEPEYLKVGDLIKGYSIVKNSVGELNILSPVGTLVTKDWYSYIGEMIEENGYLYVPVTKNNKSFSLFISLEDEKVYLQKVEFNPTK